MKDYKVFPGMTSTDESYTIKPEACKNEVKKKINLLNARQTW